jgi:FkbM family methyltransferase
MIADLIFDLGMYDGADTQFYLEKGFRVVAVEANPQLCEISQTKLAPYVLAQQLCILNVGIAEKRGTSTFYINQSRPDRSSFLPDWCASDQKRTISVETVILDEILHQYGTPYYLKIDLEHLDHVCISALERQKDLPQFVSAETSQIEFVERMFRLGYKKFKIISQILNHCIKLPFPAKEGHYVDQRFTSFHSGPFGDDTYGDWLAKKDVLDEIEKIHERDFANSIHRKEGCPEQIFLNSWFDVHAALT